MENKSNFFKFFIVLFFLNLSCAQKDPVTGDKVLYEVNPAEKAKAYVEKQGGLLSIGKNESQQTINFGNSNVLWKATLKTLDFLPLASSDYSGGILGFDWYANEVNSNEEIKVVVRFLSNEIRSDSIKITSHKRTCVKDRCVISLVGDNFSNEIKEKIITNARELKIEEARKK